MTEALSSLAETFKNVGAEGADTAGLESAVGGGGGGFVLPLGVYCRNGSGHVAFRPNTIALLGTLVPLVCAVGFTARGILRTLRR